MNELSDNKSKKIIIPIMTCRENASLPFYARPGDAGMDITAAQDVLIRPGETKAVPTGLKVAIPEGYEIQIRPRSGLSLHTPLRIPNAPGTIDSGYRDEICVIMSNNSRPVPGPVLENDSKTGSEPGGESPVYSLSEKGNKNGSYFIKTGDRIAQAVLQKVPQIEWQVMDSVTEIGNNRGGGFGSTGIQEK